MPANITISFSEFQLSKFMTSLHTVQEALPKTLALAGRVCAESHLLSTLGLRHYPPATAANRPPTPYYIRGRGMQTKHGNTGSSERLGTRWTVYLEMYQVKISNRTTYAKWVHGDETQAKAMGRIGWKKLFETAKSQVTKYNAVYKDFIEAMLKAHGLV
jgi:hypothetical protein